MSEEAASPATRRTVAFIRRFVKPRIATLTPPVRRFQALVEALSPEKRAPFAPQIPGDWNPALERVPIARSCAIEKDSLKIQTSEHVLIAKPLGAFSGHAPGGASIATLFYLHGGAFLIGSPRLFRYASRQFAAAGFDVFAPAYRLAPEHVFPAALEDVFRAYRALIDARRGPVVIAGDSAGGGLAVSLMLRLRQEGLPLPVAAALFSPWTDLAATGASARENEDRDAFFTRKQILLGARVVLGRESAKNPLASPVYADLSGLPPMIVHVGADEVLRDDSTRLVARAREAGVDARLEIWPGVPHGWPLMSFLPEARLSRAKAIAFLKEQLALKGA